MRLFEGSPAERRARLVSLLTVLAILVSALTALALLDRLFLVMNQFRQPIFMFVAGAIIAYLMAPLVRLVQHGLRNRWLSIGMSYLLLFAILVLLGVLLVNPFVTQARSLRVRLNNPSAGNLQSVNRVRAAAAQMHSELERQRALLASGQSVPQDQVQTTSSGIDALAGQVSGLSVRPRPNGEVPLPSSYLAPLKRDVARLSADYRTWRSSTALADLGDLSTASGDANRLSADATTEYRKAGSTPLLLLNLQDWVDSRGVSVDLHDKFGQAVQTVSNQLAGIINNAVTVALQAGALALDTVLVLIVSVYFLADGARFVRWLLSLVPAGSRGQADYFVTSLDKILGAYIKTQISMALLAATLDAAGAVIFGVPYAIIIFMSTFLLSLVPVIGPVILPFPPLLIAIILTPFPIPVIYAVWLLAGEQLVTNVIGPRLQGHSVGIHPLEAMAAALIGFPIAGFVGTFFAVPVVGFLHVLVRSLAQANQDARSAETASARARQSPQAGSAPVVASTSRPQDLKPGPSGGQTP